MTASMSKHRIDWTRLLRIFCAALMLSLGFAHKPVAAFVAPTAALDEAYRLPDGSFAEICEGHAGAAAPHVPGKSDHSTISLFCEACLLSSSVLIPTPDANSWAKAEFTWLDNAPVIQPVQVYDVDYQRPKARAPPVVI